MAYTLDQLLDETGINEMTGEHLNKKASAPERPNLSKLAERCRLAVDATPDERESSDQRELVEKTAAVEIIGRTLAEIQAIDTPPGQVKTASPGTPDPSVFIKQALEAGHDPEVIAQFLEKQARYGFIQRGLNRVGEMRATGAFQRAKKAKGAATEGMERATRRWKEQVRKMEDAPEAARANMLARMRVEVGPENAHLVINSAGGKRWKDMKQFQALKKDIGTPAPGSPEAAKKAVGVNVGGTSYGFTSKQLQKAKKPAMYLGGGALASKVMFGKKRDDDKRGGGPIIITR